MSLNNETEQTVQQLFALIDQNFPPAQAQQLRTLFQHFRTFISPEDTLAHASVQDMYGALLSYWRLMRSFSNEQIRVRVSNPQFEQDGWQATHSIASVLVRDMPFLVDSLRMCLNRIGLGVHVILHPVLKVWRDADGELLSVDEAPQDGQGNESQEALIHIEFDRQTDASMLEKIASNLRRSLLELRAVVDDWQDMHQTMANIIAETQALSLPVALAEQEETVEFLEWANDHFTFLGFREYQLSEQDGELQLFSVPGSGRGLLRDDPKAGPQASKSFSALPPELRTQAQHKELLLLTKANSRAPVHRDVYMDFIGIHKFDADGNVIGEYRFLGLYTASFYHFNIRSIPILRNKLAQVLTAANFRPGSHRAKALQNVLETYPRDELLQIDSSALLTNVLGILNLQERQRVRLFVRMDRYGRFVSCLVYVPRERYDSDIRKQMQQVLMDAFGGTSIEFSVALSESPLGQVHFLVRTPTGSQPEFDLPALEARLLEATREWSDYLSEALHAHNGEERGSLLFRLYANAFPLSYCEEFSARHAVYDIEQIENLEPGGLGLRLYRPPAANDEQLRFRLFHAETYLPLSEILPMLESMGVRVLSEHSYEIKVVDRAPVWIQEFDLVHNEGRELDMRELHEAFQHTFRRVWHGEIENDGFNRLVLRARMDWREIVIFRAYCKYLRQVDARFSQLYMEQTLSNNPAITRLLLGLFHARLDPKSRSSSREVSIAQSLEESLENVASLDEDRILRQFMDVIRATLRTNYFQTDAEGQPKPYLSFKFDPSKVPNLPEPRPMFEIFVYSPRVEGVHLRGGKVARGGLRWSDRPEDFRTEILGLVKAQMVKNSVIVPVGSKGGFVAKRLPSEGGREAIQAEGIACYQSFICGLLDLTDNIIDGKIHSPENTIRHDEDDPYLVVAADKGTATFSDIANQIALDYGFWLGDAFASGGANGYDHKKMGITARGAWEAVKRHFRELGRDIQTEPFSAVGIGDMSGDVFGNGMLLSEQTRLIAAFNHLHIFIDPNPDAASSFAERKRMFELPRSNWADYNSGLISQGGGIYSRQAKSIRLSPEARAALGIKVESLPPNELIQAILRAPVDLLWNGGIGTYVKASTQQHSDVGDKTNDALRINGKDLRCKVVGEGGNLGFTQLGRIEYALNGGRINTDATDNVGGVDCSDHEVNIKILLNAVVAGQDMTAKQRNQLLKDMTDDVAQRVIDNNYRQTQELSLAQTQASATVEVCGRFMAALEQQGKLDRALEFLPDDKQLEQRQAQHLGLTRPELSVLVSYSKITLYQALLDSDLPDNEWLNHRLHHYFSDPLPERFPEQIEGHRLRREIIANELTNTLVNQGGSLLVYSLNEETSLEPDNITRAFVIAWEIFRLEDLWQAIEDLDNQAQAEAQLQLMLEVRKLAERATRWLLRHGRHNEMLEQIEYFAPGLERLAELLPNILQQQVAAEDHQQVQAWLEAGVPESLVQRTLLLQPWLSGLDIVEAAAATEMPLETVAEVYFRLGEQLQLRWMQERIIALPRNNRWNTLSRSALREELYRTQRDLTVKALRDHSEGACEGCLERWLQEHQTCVQRINNLLDELSRVEQPDLAMLSVGLREIKSLL